MKKGLPDFIFDLLPLPQGGEPQEDDALILYIKEHDLNYEHFQGKKKLAPFALKSSWTSAGKKCKRRSEGTCATPASEQSSGPTMTQQLTA